MMSGRNHSRPPSKNGNSRGYPDILSEKMSRVRHDLQEDVAQLSEGARQATDWRYYVKRHPFAAAGLAALAGYALVPARRQIVQASGHEIEKLIRDGKLKVVAEGQQTKQAGLLTTSLLAIGTVTARAAMAYAGKRLGEKLEHNGSPFGHAPSE